MGRSLVGVLGFHKHLGDLPVVFWFGARVGAAACDGVSGIRVGDGWFSAGAVERWLKYAETSGQGRGLDFLE